MPPLRNTPLMKPMKTERSHEENQERAYIAASRRSDRSLEARVESARRASEIHKKRTGRSLRVTEQDVLNEEMYEEEDDDLAWQYRRMELMGNLPKMDPDFQAKFQAHVQFQVERSRILAQAVASVNQANLRLSNNQQASSPTPFMDPGMTSPPQSAYQSGYGLPPYTLSRMHSSVRQSPYPLPKGQEQSRRPSSHHRSASVATLQDALTHGNRYSQSTQTSPVESMHPDDRRVSLPQVTQHQQLHQTSPVLSRMNSAAGSPVSQQPHLSGQHVAPLAQRPPIQHHRYHSFTGPENNSWDISPLTTTLPMETQQIIGGGMFPIGPAPDFPMNDQSHLFYSCNPGSKGKHTGSEGMDQTLMPKSLDSNFNSASDPSVYNPWFDGTTDEQMTSVKSETTFDNSFLYNQAPFDLLGNSDSELSTPEGFNAFVDGDMFADHQPAH